MQEHESKGLVADEWAVEVTRVVGGVEGKRMMDIWSKLDLSILDEAVKAAVYFLDKLDI